MLLSGCPSSWRAVCPAVRPSRCSLKISRIPRRNPFRTAPVASASSPRLGELPKGSPSTSSQRWQGGPQDLPPARTVVVGKPPSEFEDLLRHNWGFVEDLQEVLDLGNSLARRGGGRPHHISSQSSAPEGDEDPISLEPPDPFPSGVLGPYR